MTLATRFLSCPALLTWLVLSLAAPVFGAASPDMRQDRIALVMKALSNPFFAAVKEGAESYASAHRLKLDVFGIERETDVDQQITLVESLLARGYQSIVLAPADSRRLVPVCLKALRAGAKIVVIDNRLDGEALGPQAADIPFIGHDNEQAAQRAAEVVADKLGRQGRVLVLTGIPGAANSDQRLRGFLKAFSKWNGLKVVDVVPAHWHKEKAFAEVSRRLHGNERIDAVVCANDQMALGAIEALWSAGLAGRTIVSGYDNLRPMREAIANGTAHVTVEQHPDLMGRLGVETVAAMAGGARPPALPPVPVDLVSSATVGRRLALLLSNLSSPFCQELAQGVRRAAEIFGASLRVEDAGEDESQQLAQLSRLTAQDVDAIILSPVNAQSIVPGIEAANAARVPVATVDRAAAEGTVLTSISSDNAQGGRLAAEFISRRIGGARRVLEIEGQPGASTAFARGKGFHSVIEQATPPIVHEREVGHFNRLRAKAAVEKRLARGDVFDAIFAHNDPMILGALDAYVGKGLPRPPLLVGFDAIPEALQALRRGDLDASVAQNPLEMGRLAVSSIMAARRGEAVPGVITVNLKLAE